MATTANILLNQPAYGSTSPTWDQPLNYNATILDNVFGATTTVAVNTGAVPTYTNITAPNSSGTGSTSQCMRINLTGALAANQTVFLPQGIAGMWVVTNSTTNAFSITLGSNNGSNIAAGTTVTLSQGYSTLVYCDGLNVKRADDASSATGGVTSFQTSLNGLTPSTSTTGAVTLAGTLGASSGGTGITSPGAIGNVLTSNGLGQWVSQAPSAGSYTGSNGVTVSGTVISLSGSYTGSFTASTNLVATNGSVTAKTNITATTGNITATAGNVTAPAGYVSAGSSAYPRIYYSTTGTGYANIDFSSTTGISYQVGVTALSFGIAGTQAVTMTANSLRTANSTTNYADNGIGTWNTTSDIALKKDIAPLTGAAQRIANLNPVNFTWKKDDRPDWGFIAQEFETIYPKSVVTDGDGLKSIGLEMKFWADIISTIQELHKKIESLEARLAAKNV